MSDTVVIVNKSGDTEVVFEIAVEGVKSKDLGVRLVVHATKLHSYMVKAEHINGDSWKVVIPESMNVAVGDTADIEVLVDDYRFVPIKDIQFKERKVPTVEATIVKESVELEEKVIMQSPSYGDSISTKLLVPEEDPSKPTPPDPLKQEKTDERNEDVLKSISSAETPGTGITIPKRSTRSLFKRGSDGKLVIPGLTDEQDRQELAGKQAKAAKVVRELVSQTSAN